MHDIVLNYLKMPVFGVIVSLFQHISKALLLLLLLLLSSLLIVIIINRCSLITFQLSCNTHMEVRLRFSLLRFLIFFFSVFIKIIIMYSSGDWSEVAPARRESAGRGPLPEAVSSGSPWICASRLFGQLYLQH